MIATIKQFVNAPSINVFVGIVLLTTALSEVWTTLHTDLFTLNLKAGHGMMLFAMAHTLKAVAEAIEKTKKSLASVAETASIEAR
jgi:hypothetical protein